MNTLRIAQKIARYAKWLGFTVEHYASDISDSVYPALWYSETFCAGKYRREVIYFDGI
jgi:hypothetical protein